MKALFPKPTQLLYCALLGQTQSPLLPLYCQHERVVFKDIFTSEMALVEAVNDDDFCAKLFLYDSFSGRHFCELILSSAVKLFEQRQMNALCKLFSVKMLQPLRAATVVLCWPRVTEDVLR